MPHNDQIYALVSSMHGHSEVSPLLKSYSLPCNIKVCKAAYSRVLLLFFLQTAGQEIAPHCSNIVLLVSATRIRSARKENGTRTNIVKK